jgi:hypothetical protein
LLTLYEGGGSMYTSSFSDFTSVDDTKISCSPPTSQWTGYIPHHQCTPLQREEYDHIRHNTNIILYLTIIRATPSKSSW